MSYHLLVVHYSVPATITNCIRLYIYDCHLVFTTFHFLMFERMISDVVSAGTMATPVRAVVNVAVSPYSAPVLSVTAGVKKFGPGTSNR